eukprot:1237517-Pyramimonas_sp.AAC.1
MRHMPRLAPSGFILRARRRNNGLELTMRRVITLLTSSRYVAAVRCCHRHDAIERSKSKRSALLDMQQKHGCSMFCQ